MLPYLHLHLKITVLNKFFFLKFENYEIFRSYLAVNKWNIDGLSHLSA